MKKLYLAEICKIKRMKMTYVAYIGILFSMIISSVQLLGRVQDATFEQLASMFTYNNVLLAYLCFAGFSGSGNWKKPAYICRKTGNVIWFSRNYYLGI